MINIIGAGPAGCYAAYLLAKRGKEVSIYEEHKKVGLPLQCTGIVTQSIQNTLKFDIPKKIILNSIDKVKIFSPNNKFIELKLRNKNLVIDRTKFDNYIWKKAKEAGAKTHTQHKFLTLKNNHLFFKNNSTIKKIKFNKKDTLIGADGPNSVVSKIINKKINTKYLIGLQARVKLKNKNYVEFFPHIGSFAWIVPENKDVVRIGVASYKNTKKDFEHLLKLKKIKPINIISKQAGLIPLYNPKIKIQKNNIYLLGDSATQIKSTTGGGLVHNITAANTLAKSIFNNENYQKNFNKENKIDLTIHLYLRRFMDKFSKNDWNYLAYLFKKKKIKQVIEKFDRDYPSNFMLKLILREPRLLYFSSCIFK